MLLVLKLTTDLMLDKYRLAGCDGVLIMPSTMLTQAEDGNYYYDKSNILKVYTLM